MVFALIKDGVVHNTIVATQEFMDEQEDLYFAEYSALVRIDELSPMPGIGWLYDGTDFDTAEKLYAVVNSDVVESILFVHISNVDGVQSANQYAIMIQDVDPQPAVGWTYDNVTGEFTAP